MSETPFRVQVRRDVIVASGKDARTFLHSQLSNDIASLTPGRSTYAFALDPGGKLNALLRVRCLADDHFVLDTDAGSGVAALARLNKFKIRVQCNFDLDTVDVVAVRGLARGGRDALARDEGALLVAHPSAVAAWRIGDGAADYFSISDAYDSIRLGSQAEFEVERVRRAWPTFGIDISDASLPAETGLIDVAVSFTKGCYPGQELVERMDSRGTTAPRVLMRLPAQMQGEPRGVIGGRAEVGGPYVIAGVDVGACTSVAGEFALVLVSRPHVQLATEWRTK